MKDTLKTVSIIGAGIAGLASSIRLTLLGYEVSVYEANDYPGGKLFDWTQEGYRFDMGPTVFTMPSYLKELFDLAGKDMNDYIEIIQPEIPFHYFFEDGLVLQFHSDLEKLIFEIASKTNDQPEAVRAYLNKAETKFELTKNVFLHNSLNILSNYLTKDALRGMIRIGEVEVFTSMDKSNRSAFTDKRTVDLFNSFASYLGSNPYKAPGVLNVISHFQINGGVYFPVGGMQSILNATYKLACELGVKFHFGQKVDRILVEKKKVCGISIGGVTFPSDLVVSNMDVYFAYKHLMPDQKEPKKVLDHPKSHSVLVFHWGMKKSFPQLALHNMFLSADMSDEYGTIYKNADIGDHFTYYINVSKKINDSDAPAGCENWYVLVNAPNLQGQDWDAMQLKVRKKLLQKMEKALGEDVEQYIQFERIRDPRDHAQQTNIAFGAIYGNSFDQTFSVFHRHPNFSKRIHGLYFCGGTVHPGSGVPLTLLSAKIVSDLIVKKYSQKVGSNGK